MSVQSAYIEFAEARGFEQIGQLDAGPLTPLLVESKSCRLQPAVRGRFSGAATGVAGQLSYTRNKTFRFNVALTQVPASTAFAPRVFCIRQGRRTRDDEYHGFEARDSKLWTESAALAERYLVSTSPFQDQNWLRQLFAPGFIDWLSTEPPADFSFELAYGALLGSIEEDKPTPASLAALWDATAHVAERIAGESEE